MRKTKIICTLGPAIDSDEMLKKMIKNGLDCARLNFSHGTHEEHLTRIERVKRVRKELGMYIPILLDTKGPEIRLKKFENDVNEGKNVSLKDYVIDEQVDYTNKVSNIGYNIGNTIEKFMNEGIKKTLKVISALFYE